MTVLSLSRLALPQSLQLTRRLLVLHLCPFQHFPSSVFCSFYLRSPPTAPLLPPVDGCPRHLCSVSQMSHNRTWNINLAVDTAEKWWGGVKVFLSCCPQRCGERYWTPCLFARISQWNVTATGRRWFVLNSSHCWINNGCSLSVHCSLLLPMT